MRVKSEETIKTNPFLTNTECYDMKSDIITDT